MKSESITQLKCMSAVPQAFSKVYRPNKTDRYCINYKQIQLLVNFCSQSKITSFLIIQFLVMDDLVFSSDI